ncbi:ATP-binding cassette domain-containing protein [Exiguobacterium sp. SL14]|nr:ATP-binding cassette domain-containing protein [Exiguobacterium sp. SL14]MCY1691865.1 ATP-binding cassette domain-containing protein [Exiguobacterium sp. SL14]
MTGSETGLPFGSGSPSHSCPVLVLWTDCLRSVLSLSGGERVRLQLAVLVHSSINVLILDEPTNHLDIESRETLEEALENFSGTLIAVSHDRYFLNRLFPQILWLENGLTRYHGTYTYAQKKRTELVTPSSIKVVTPKRLSQNELEVQIERLERKLAKREGSTDTVSKAIQQQLDDLYEQLLQYG